jgi:hypothetical protein
VTLLAACAHPLGKPRPAIGAQRHDALQPNRDDGVRQRRALHLLSRASVNRADQRGIADATAERARSGPTRLAGARRADPGARRRRLLARAPVPHTDDRGEERWATGRSRRNRRSTRYREWRRSPCRRSWARLSHRFEELWTMRAFFLVHGRIVSDVISTSARLGGGPDEDLVERHAARRRQTR